MGKNYNRKKISNLDDLDLEETRIKRKLRRLEEEWTEILDPQQLAIGFLTNFISKKITGWKSSDQRKQNTSSGKQHLVSEDTKPLNKDRKSSRLKKILKIAGISIATIFIIRKMAQHQRKPKQTSNIPGK